MLSGWGGSHIKPSFGCLSAKAAFDKVFLSASLELDALGTACHQVGSGGSSYELGALGARRH